MARLPKNIIKKYGISKKAWAVFQGRKARGKTSMARKKSNKGKSMPKWASMLLGFGIDTVLPLGMGLVRAKIGDGIQKVAQKAGLNSAYTDEAVLMTAEGALGLIPNHWVKRASRNLQAIEKERIAEMVALKIPALGTGASASGSSGLNFY